MSVGFSKNKESGIVVFVNVIIYAMTRVLIVMICGFLTMDKYPYIAFISTLFGLSYIATQIILYINESKIKSKEFESIENEKIKND